MNREVFKNMTCSKVWRDTSEEKMDGVLVVSSGKGERYTLCHVGSEETGSRSGCMLLFRGTSSNESSDYHPKMNRNVFSDRCEKKVFPAMRVAGKIYARSQ